MWKYRKNNGPGVAKRLTSARSLWVIASLAGLAGLAMAWGPDVAALSTEHPIEWDGERWSAFSSEEKAAFLGGFLAGAAASQAYAGARVDSIFDPEALADRLARVRSERALHFPYGANLYYVRLHDYYFYVDRRDRPLYRAIAELNHQLQTLNR